MRSPYFAAQGTFPVWLVPGHVDAQIGELATTARVAQELAISLDGK